MKRPATIPTLRSRLLIFGALLFMVPHLHAQQDGRMMGQPMVRGTVTTVAPNQITVKTEQGESYTVVLSNNTRVIKDRQPAKATDIQVGDGLGAAGEVDTKAKTIHAAIAMDVSAAEMKKALDSLGKTVISGKVTKLDIDNLTITVLRPDNITQTFTVDENTTFRRARQRGPNAPAPQTAADADIITLADIKVGDNLAGRGALKDNVFVASQLILGGAGNNPMGGMPGGIGGGRRPRNTTPTPQQ